MMAINFNRINLPSRLADVVKGTAKSKPNTNNNNNINKEKDDSPRPLSPVQLPQTSNLAVKSASSGTSATDVCIYRKKKNKMESVSI